MLRSGLAAMMSLSWTIQPGSARAPSHWLSEMMMLYWFDLDERDVAAFWKSWSNGDSSKAKLTSYPYFSLAYGLKSSVAIDTPIELGGHPAIPRIVISIVFPARLLVPTAGVAF